MMKRVLLGMLTPSSNTVLEPTASAIVAGLPEVSIHFGRFRVTEISLSDAALDQFDDAPLLAAAGLLADARVDVIAWNGTSGGWLGFDADRRLCLAITRRTGAAATTSTLALGEAFRALGVTRYGLVTPYVDDIQSKIVANFADEGFECAAERHLGALENFSFSEVDEEQIAESVRSVAAAGPQVVTIYCTNLRGAAVTEALEREIGIPILDSVSVTLWACLRLAGVDTRRVKGWGRLFADDSLAMQPKEYA